MSSPADQNTVIRIRKYANRRLYNTATSEFVTLADLAQMVKSGQEFVVEDVTTGADLTSAVLIQIIAEQEANGEHLLPLGYLRQLIGFYGADVDQYLSTYLEQTLQTFTNNQQQFVDQIQRMFNSETPMQAIAEQNLALFKTTMDTFANMTGFAPPRGTQPDRTGPSESASASKDDEQRDKELTELKAALASLQQRVDSLDNS